MEKLAIYDSNNNVIENEFVYRKEKLTLPEGKHFKIILLFIQDEQSKFLIQKVSPKKGNVYAITGGHVTYKDSSLKTVIKEAKEEMNLDIDQSKLILFDTIMHPKAIVDCYYIKMNIDLKKLSLQKEEVSDIYLLSEKEINNLIENKQFREGNIQAYNKILSLIKNNKI